MSIILTAPLLPTGLTGTLDLTGVVENIGTAGAFRNDPPGTPVDIVYSVSNNTDVDGAFRNDPPGTPADLTINVGTGI